MLSSVVSELFYSPRQFLSMLIYQPVTSQCKKTMMHTGKNLCKYILMEYILFGEVILMYKEKKKGLNSLLE